MEPPPGPRGPLRILLVCVSAFRFRAQQCGLGIVNLLVTFGESLAQCVRNGEGRLGTHGRRHRAGLANRVSTAYELARGAWMRAERLQLNKAISDVERGAAGSAISRQTRMAIREAVGENSYTALRDKSSSLLFRGLLHERDQ